MSKRACVTCGYWEPNDATSHGLNGHCMRYPPRAALDFEGTGLGQFPRTVASEWCGEWKDKHEGTWRAT